MATPATSLERPMPQNMEAERSILGAILLDNNALNAAIEKLKPEDFFHDHHRRIYQQMIALGETQQAIDLVTLTDQLHRAGELESSGGPAYIAQLMDGVPHVTNVEHYARIVKEKALLRGLIHATHAIQQQALEGEEDADAILDRAESSIFQLAEDRARTGLVGMHDVVTESRERISHIYEGGHRITGLSTGYDLLDNLTSGFQSSELLILAARPSMGKTAFALNLAENVAVRANKPVAIFSLEMSKESLLLRLLSADARIDSHKFRTGHLNQDDKARIPKSLSRLSEAPLWIDDAGSATVVEMGAKLRRLKRDKGLDLVIVDYLQLVSARGRFGNRNEEVSSITRGLKALAKELKVPMLVLSQLTRAPEREDREPRLADLRESGAIEQDADVVMFIHRPNFYKKSDEVSMEERGETDLIIAKQRNGPTDNVRFVFQGSFTRFELRAPDAWTESQ
ncbi:MAG TPA: replicative DNA helicase [Candidatus Dormibacteraeota bacterium]|nr:replicative DNA helicase [Candidatus Dormibacteraeota bacterium]